MDDMSQKTLAAVQDVLGKLLSGKQCGVIEEVHTSIPELQTLDLLHVSVLEVDSNGHVVYANLSAKEIFGDIEYISEQTESNVLKLIAANIAINKEDNTFPVHREIYEESSSTWYRITSDRFLLPNGQAVFFNTIDDISEWKINEYHLKMSAAMDEMTGTYNRKSGLEELENIVTQAISSKTHCIAFVDIDSLKPINDNYGHREGDYAIKSIANVLLGIISFSNCSNSSFNGADLLKQADQKMYQCKAKKRRYREELRNNDG